MNSCSVFLENLLMRQAHEQEEPGHGIDVWHCHCPFRIMSLSS